MRGLRRKRLLVSTNQALFCLKILVLSSLPVLLVALTALVVCFRLQKSHQALVPEAGIAPHFILAFFVAHAAVTWVTLLVYTNRVFGPIHRLERQIGRVVSGEIPSLPAMRFRDHDEFRELAESLNRMGERASGREGGRT